MKKLWLFTAILIFLASVGWGQNTYVHVSGGWSWEDKDNWVDENGDPVSFYPGENSSNDIVIINGTSVSISSSITLGTLEIINDGTSQPYLQIDDLLTVANLILDGTIHIAGSQSTLYIENIIVTPNGEAYGTIDMNGSIIQVPNYPGTLIINPVTGDLGNIIAGDRNVTITIPPNSNINIGDIKSTGNISIIVGDDSDVHIGDINSGGNIVINAGTGSTVDVSDIDAGGTISTPGDGNITISSPNTYDWIGATNSNWNVTSNWLGGTSPGDGNSSYKINIHVSSSDPVFSGTTGLTCDTLEIQSGASLNMGTYNLTVGTLENHGNLTLAGDLTVTTLDNSGNLILTGSGQSITPPSVGGTVTYNNASSIDLAGLTSFTNLVIQNGARNIASPITVSGDFTLADGSLDAVSISVNGTSSIAGNVTTSGIQTYSGAVTLGGSVGVTGTTVTLGAITGGGNSLTITGNGVLNGGSGIGALSVVSGNFTLNNALSATTVSISGTSAINANINTTGTQTYTGAVTLGGTNVTRTLTGSTVTLGTITGGGNSLTIAGNGELNGGSGIEDLSVSGSAVINGNITTTGTQTYSVAVTLDGTVGTKILIGTTVTLGNITGGGNSLIINGNGVLNGGSGINILTVNGTTITINGNITTTGTQTYTGAVTLGGTVGTKTLTGSTVTLGAITGGGNSLTITGSAILNDGSDINILSVTGTTISINADITTSGNQTYTGAVTLGGAGTRTLTSTGGSITASGVVSGANVIVNASQGISLTGANSITTSVELTSTAGNIEFNNNRGGVGNLTVTAETNNGNITITETTGTVLGTLEGRDITVNAGGNIALTDITGRAVELNAGYPNHETYGTPGTVTLTTVTITTGLTIWCERVYSSSGTGNIGSVDINTDNKDDVEDDFSDYYTISGAQSNKERPNNFEFGPLPQKYPKYTHISSGTWPPLNTIDITGSSQIYITGTITALGDLTINTESGDIIFEGAYNAGSYNLNLNTTSGKIDQAVGSVITVDNLTINAGGAVTLAQNNMVNNLTIVPARGNVDYKNNKALVISGINAGANTVKLTVTGNITLSANINASSITIDSGSITGSGTATASTGDISLVNSVAGNNNISLNSFNAPNGIINVSTNAKNIVYYSSVPPATPPTGGTWGTTPLFVEAYSTYNRNVKLQTNGIADNIYLVDVVDSSQKTLTVDSSAGTGANGFIEFFATTPGENSYTYTGANSNHLDLLPGAGGVRIRTSVVDFIRDFNINGARLTLDGSGESGIKAANINLGDITATTNTADKITLEASGNITIGGNVTANQLIAKAPNGTVSVNRITITSNTGNERETAAIYIVANIFVVTSTATGSIVPGGRPGGGAQWGQLCLDLKNEWKDPSGLVDGDEDEVDGNDVPLGNPGARWHQHFHIVVTGRILYSFTEDSNGNGRLDRIRVQTNTALNGNFYGFDVTVEDYEIDRTIGTRGFQIVGVTDDDSFYIYLIENIEVDGGNTPLWSVTGNSTLEIKNAVGSKVGDPAVDINIKPIDTIPPRIAYTLTLPGNPQTYAQMTESVVSSSGAGVSASFGGPSIEGVLVDIEHFGYLFNHSDSYKIDELANFPNIENDTTSIAGNGYFQMENIVDNGSEPNIDPAYPPKYPLNWGYTAYASNNSNTFKPPNKLLTADMMAKLANNQGVLVTPNSDPVIRRVTDVLVSRIPSATNDDNYFTWPVWARFKTPLNTDSYANDDAFWGQRNTDTGIIWQFDGTGYLDAAYIEKNDGVELQARINNNITVNPVLFWTTADVPVENRNPQEAPGVRKAGGLWLPNMPPPGMLYNYVPLSDGINERSAASSSAKLFNYDIAADSLAIGGNAKFEFIFRLSGVSDMFVARLDVPRGAAIPANWYSLVRPFVFEIRNIRKQRGGVTILNNVINSDKKEVTLIRYHLLRPGRVTVQIYTLDGTLVKSLRRNDQRGAGEWTDGWDGTNNGGRAVARGMYFVRVVGPDIDEIRKIMVVK